MERWAKKMNEAKVAKSNAVKQAQLLQRELEAKEEAIRKQIQTEIMESVAMQKPDAITVGSQRSMNFVRLTQNFFAYDPSRVQFRGFCNRNSWRNSRVQGSPSTEMSIIFSYRLRVIMHVCIESSREYCLGAVWLPCYVCMLTVFEIIR